VSHADAPPQFFATTHWSMVMQAGDQNSGESLRALEELCQVYWRPLFAYARGLGHGLPQAEDLTQGFFAKLLEKNYLGIADRRKGRFRWFLLTAFKGFLANEHDRETALKRGGAQGTISLEGAMDECSGAEGIDHQTPDFIYEKKWALTLLGAAREQLKREFAEAGKQDRFENLEPHLVASNTGEPYAILAARLGTTEGALAQEMRRLRKRYAELIRAEVGKTVVTVSEVDAELAYLMEVLGR
jgi:DNA-directed RNA polymerase specialized sigma24 family protein